MDYEEFGEATPTPPVTTEAEGWDKSLGCFFKSAITPFVCLSTHPPCQQTNKQTKQQKFITVTQWRCDAKRGTLKLGAHLQCSRSILHNSMLGSLSKPTILDAFNSNVIWDFHLSANYSFPQNGLWLTLKAKKCPFKQNEITVSSFGQEQARKPCSYASSKLWPTLSVSDRGEL